MADTRRGFLGLLVRIAALAAYPLRILPEIPSGLAFRRAQPQVARVVGRTILPGHRSTVMVLGSNLHTVRAVRFDSCEVSAEIVESGAGHLMLQLETAACWAPGAGRMHLHTDDGGVATIRRELLADAARQVAPYGQYSYGRYPPYGASGSPDAWPAVIGGHLL